MIVFRKFPASVQVRASYTCTLTGNFLKLSFIQKKPLLLLTCLISIKNGPQLFLIENSSTLCGERNRENLLCYYNTIVHAHIVPKRNQIFLLNGYNHFNR